MEDSEEGELRAVCLNKTISRGDSTVLRKETKTQRRKGPWSPASESVRGAWFQKEASETCRPSPAHFQSWAL